MTKFTQCRDELGSVGITVADDHLVRLALLGLPKSWHSYRDSMNGREKLPNWEHLWSDLVQEEFRWNTRDGSSSKTNDEENCSLDGKENKGKGKKSLVHLAEILTLGSDTFDQISEISPNFFNPARNRRYTNV